MYLRDLHLRVSGDTVVNSDRVHTHTWVESLATARPPDQQHLSGCRLQLSPGQPFY